MPASQCFGLSTCASRFSSITNTRAGSWPRARYAAAARSSIRCNVWAEWPAPRRGRALSTQVADAVCHLVQCLGGVARTPSRQSIIDPGGKLRLPKAGVVDGLHSLRPDRAILYLRDFAHDLNIEPVSQLALIPTEPSIGAKHCIAAPGVFSAPDGSGFFDYLAGALVDAGLDHLLAQLAFRAVGAEPFFLESILG